MEFGDASHMVPMDGEFDGTIGPTIPKSQESISRSRYYPSLRKDTLRIASSSKVGPVSRRCVNLSGLGRIEGEISQVFQVTFPCKEPRRRLNAGRAQDFPPSIHPIVTQ